MSTGKRDRARRQGGVKKVTRRQFLKGLGVLMASGIAAPGGVFAVGGRNLRIGTFGPSHCAATFVYSEVAGLYRDAGATVSLMNYPVMASIAADLAAGRIEMGQLVVPLAFALHAGAKPFPGRTPVVVPLIAGINGSALVVGKRARISRPADFKGKRVASHSPLAVNHIVNMLFLEANGLDPRREVTIRQIELSKVVDSLAQGEIDAFAMPEPVNAVAEQKGVGSLYLPSKAIWPGHPCCALVCRQDFFEKNQDDVAAVARAMTKAALTINNTEARAETVRRLHGTTGFGYNTIPLEVLSTAFTPGRADFSPFPWQSSALLIIEIMKRHGLLPAGVDDKRLAGEVFLSAFARKTMKDVGAAPPDTDVRAEKIIGKLRVFRM